MNSPFEITKAIQTLISTIERQATRNLTISFPHNDGPEGVLLLVNRLNAYEALSRDFQFSAELLSNKPDLELKDLNGKMVTIALKREDGGKRYFNGYIHDFRFVKNDAGFSYYDMVVLPWLAFLRHRKDNYLFHDKTVVEQTEDIFSDYLAADWKSNNLGANEPMTFACQYDESDYNYLHRRWEALGWHYHYEHREDGHTLMLSGDSTLCEDIGDGDNAISWQGDSGIQKPGLNSFSAVRTLASTHYAASSFDFKGPRPLLENVPSVNQQGKVPKLEVYEYAGAYGFKDGKAGEAFVRLRMEELEAAAKHFEGVGDDDRVLVGHAFKLTGHTSLLDMIPGQGPDKDDTHFLITEVVHNITNNYETGQSDPAQYRNRISCIRRKIPWRPGRGFNSIEPRIYGIQTARVVGPSGEEVYTDEYNRVKVQFHWDRKGNLDAGSSAWLRLLTDLAGQNFGTTFTPRIGQEVAVQWLDGNPDHPVITGSFYNRDNMPPRFNHVGDLPGNRYVFGTKTKEVFGTQFVQVMHDNTPGQISYQAACEYRMGSLTIGEIRSPRSGGRADPRGEGFELRTDGVGAVRGGQGLLFSTEPQEQARGPVLARDSLQGLVDVMQGIVAELGRLSEVHHASGTDPEKLKAWSERLKQWEYGSNTEPNKKGGGAPIVAVSAAAGAGIASHDNLLLGAQTNIDAVSGGHTQLSAAGETRLRAGRGFSAFTDKGGMEIIAGQGDIGIEAHGGHVRIFGAKSITVGAAEDLTLSGKTVKVCAEGAQTAWGSGSITEQASGAFAIQSASFGHSGGGGGAPIVLNLPGSTFSTNERYVIRHRASGRPKANQGYRIELDDGRISQGVTDEQGRTELAAADAMRIAKVILLKR